MFWKNHLHIHLKLNDSQPHIHTGSSKNFFYLNFECKLWDMTMIIIKN
jgi:hypothetical protein